MLLNRRRYNTGEPGIGASDLVSELVRYCGFPAPAERLVWLDLLKVIAAFAVVMTHIASIGWQTMSPENDSWLATSIYEIVTRFAVPAFFMASGALMLNPRRYLPPRKIVRYALKTAFAALSTSFAYCLCERALLGWHGWHELIRATIDGPYFIWYLWVLVGLYALTPPLRLIAADRRMLPYAIGLLAGFVLLKETANAMSPEGELTLLLNNFILFSEDAEGVFYYLLGAWLISHELSPFARRSIIAIGSLSICAAIQANYASASAIGADLYYVARGNILIALWSIAVFEAVRRLARHCDTSSAPNTLSRLAAAGLGVYLLHPFLRLIMEQQAAFHPAVRWLLEDPLIAIPLVSAAIWSLSALVSVIATTALRHITATERR